MCVELVPGVLVNGRPLTLDRSCSICRRRRSSRPSWALYEDQVLCAVADAAREGQGRRAERPLTLPVIDIGPSEMLPGDEGTRGLFASGHTLGDVAAVRHDAWIDRTPNGKRYVAKCSCGYLSAGRTMERLALAAAVHHIAKLVNEAKRNGQPKPLASIADPASTIASHPPRTLDSPAHVGDQLPGGAATG